MAAAFDEEQLELEGVESDEGDGGVAGGAVGEEEQREHSSDEEEGC